MKRSNFRKTAWILAVPLILATVDCSRQPSLESVTSGGAAMSVAARSAAAPAPGGGSTAAEPSSSRRVIRTAELWLEVDSPQKTGERIRELVDGAGGFVASADTHHTGTEGDELEVTTVVARVPVAAFEPTLDKVRPLAKRVTNEHIAGQDVTEEYSDLEARLRAQRAVLEQYLLVLREAKTVPDILAVQQKAGEIQVEIERAEGRRRLLENQVSLSTITVHAQHHADGVDAIDARGPGFGRSIRLAGRDTVLVSAGIVNGAIRLFGYLAPIVLVLGLPCWILLRLWRRMRANSSAGPSRR